MVFKMLRKPNFKFYPFLIALVSIVIIMIILTWKFELHKTLSLLTVFILAGRIDTRSVNPNGNVCLEKGCVLAAADILNSMDETIDPCTGNVFLKVLLLYFYYL